MLAFDVTYEIYTPASVEHGDADERGFIAERIGLREAIDLIGNHAHVADESPVVSPRWLTNLNYAENFATGATEHRSLHVPACLTSASRRRIARLLGVCV